jgi:hypothetical protein
VKRQLQTRAVPLALLTTYYRRDLRIPPGSVRSRPGDVAGRRRTVRIAVSESPDDELRSGAVDVTVVEFATHAAYLEPVTGMGLLVSPLPQEDVVVAGERCERDTWPAERADQWPTVGFTLNEADQMHALERLADSGWTLLEASGGGVAQVAGYTSEGRQAACLYAERSTYDQLVLEDFHLAFTALHAAADLLPER